MPEDNIFSEAKRLHRLGFAILWLYPRSKRPIGNAWTSGPRKSWEELKATYRPGMNAGVRLGAPSALSGAYLAVIDVDVKSASPRHRKQAVEAASIVLRGARCPVVRSGRGNGSRHYYVVTEAPFQGFDAAQSTEEVRVLMPSVKPSAKERKLITAADLDRGWRIRVAWEVTLMSEGRQTVIPPSIHPDSGKPYYWSRDLTKVGELPLLETPERPKKSDIVVGSGAGEVPVLEDFSVSPVELSWLPVSTEIRAAIVDGTGVSDRSGYLLKASSALFSAGLTTNEVLTVLTDKLTYLGACAYDHAQTTSRRRAAEWVYRYTVERVAKERSGVDVFRSAPLPGAARKLTLEEQKAQAEELTGERNWRQNLDCTEKGRARVTLKNLDLIFTNAVHENVFIEDLFASRIEYGTDTPWGGKGGQYVQDIDMLRVKRWLADTEFRIEPAKEAIFEATMLVADRRRIHPVRDWLDRLKWDGQNRINSWLRDYCRGKGPEPYLSEVSRTFLHAMVKRIFEPGCQMDYMLVLEGIQGQKKSTIARAIASDRWFMDNLPDLKDKDSMLNLQGKWLIELAELASIKHTDFNMVKAYVSRRVDTVRPHYGRLKADVPRQSVFIGTVNEGQYFKDPTGNRRYWPVKVGRCDVTGLMAVRNQLFAEAMSTYREGKEALMLSPIAEKQAKEVQDHRRVDDDESEMRDALLSFQESPSGTVFPFHRFKTRDLMVGPNAPWGPWANRNYVTQNAAHVLHSLGFEKKKTEGQRFWRTPKKRAGQTSKKGSAPGMPRLPRIENDDFF